MRTKQASTDGNWIPCSVREPDESDWYLVTTIEDGKRTVDMAYWTDNGISGFWIQDGDILAWMDPPKPWEGVRQNG